MIQDIRHTFLKYFQNNGHQIVTSSPLVPQNDPSLMFTNSGMVQFKNVFTGLETRPYKRATTAQKCLRAGGKHNDLDNVGYTARHHTFFEMLGNFSFGDYFKEEAILMAWELVTQHLGINKDKVYITVYMDDNDAASLWKKIAGLSDHKIIRISTSDNFWSMGDTGPCGPCSEIFYDHGAHIAGGLPGSPDQDGDRFVEIWNLVFMQFEQHADGRRTPLPQPSIDTGMGLERVQAVLEGVTNNYETDTLKALVVGASALTNTPQTDPYLISQRVIADHIRAASFLIADGVLPSNEGRGYVLRRIMRRAMRHGYLLGAKEPLLFRLFPILLDKMGTAYPELKRASDLITLTLRLEEEKFLETLARGMKVLEDEARTLAAGGLFSGKSAFKLYDTYGFPLDLTEDVLKSRSIQVDTSAFTAAMDEQKALARASWVGSGETTDDKIWFDIREKNGASEFLGYQTLEAEGTALALVHDGDSVHELKAGQSGFLITNQTPFYGESGGQMGDTGVFIGRHGHGTVTHTFRAGGDLVVHEITLTEGYIKHHDHVTLQVDVFRRNQLRANHSATHLLHAALQKHLGATVTQKGSLVAPDKLRFDFSHSHAVPHDTLINIEKDVNRMIRANEMVTTHVMSLDQAMEEGATALFGEKYRDSVRVVSMGESLSKELCGGTHVRYTGDIGLFKILSESGIASGVRRIEATTGEAAEDHMHQIEQGLKAVADRLKTSPKLILNRIDALMEEKKQIERDLKAIRTQSTQKSNISIEKSIIQDVQVWSLSLPGISSRDLKAHMDTYKKEVGSGVILLTSSEGEISTLLLGITPDLSSRFDASELIKHLASSIGLKGGGGRSDLAQAGGTVSHPISQAVDTLRKYIETHQSCLSKV